MRWTWHGGHQWPDGTPEPPDWWPLLLIAVALAVLTAAAIGAPQ